MYVSTKKVLIIGVYNIYGHMSTTFNFILPTNRSIDPDERSYIPHHPTDMQG